MRGRGGAVVGLVAAVLLSAGCTAVAGRDPRPAPRPSTAVTTAAPGSTSVAYEDVTFVQMMLAHDRQTVQICALLLAKHGVDPAVRTMAEQMTGSRSPEITQLTTWLTTWGVDESPLEHEHAGRTHGLLRPGQLAAFARADGASAQEAFLETMISHDQAAQEIADTVIATGAHAGVRRLARASLATNGAEIAELERLRPR